MKKYYLLLAFLVVGLTGWASSEAHERPAAYGYGDAFIFEEGGVEFAIYPDGQFDFFFNERRTGYAVNIVRPNINISYNAGYNYNPFVQYDDFGAVIQIERVPIFYDYYGRIVQAGNIYISYNHFGMISRIGNLYLHYNPHNRFTHYSGFINGHNPYYVYRPWHDFYRRPVAQYSIVYHQPYRAYYYPNRVSFHYHQNYYNTYYTKGYKKSYYRPGQPVTSYNRGRRTAEVRDLSPRTFSSDYSEARVVNSSNSRSSTTVNRTRTGTVKQEVQSNRTRVRTPETNSRTSSIREQRDSAARTVPQDMRRRTETSVQKQPARVETPVRRSREVNTRTPQKVEQTRQVQRATPASTGRQVRQQTQAPVRTATPATRSSRGRGN